VALALRVQLKPKHPQSKPHRLPTPRKHKFIPLLRSIPRPRRPQNNAYT